jgi:hypothetical protein
MGLIAVVSCSDSSDNDGDGSSAGARSGSGGSGGSKSTAGNAGTTPIGPGGAGGGGGSAGTGGGEPRPCQEYRNEAACEAAGCVPTTGTLSKLLPTGEGGAAGLGGARSAGGAGGARVDGAACELVEDFFISCEEGAGGATYETACNASCTECLGGPWTVGNYEPFRSHECEVWTCVDSRAQPGLP